MRFIALATLIFQLAPQMGRGIGPDAVYQPYQRTVSSVMRAGQACVVLDAAALAHAALPGATDLRLYRGPASQEVEVPYALAESSADPSEAETVPVRNERVHGSRVEFDLRMPDRPWSEIDLLTGHTDFIAAAHVTGSGMLSARGNDLGTVALFDFSGQHLPASTQLQLAEASFPWVHVAVQFFNTNGGPVRVPLSEPVFTAAQVPPSRQAQVLYTSVAEAALAKEGGQETGANLSVAAHVPVERVRFEVSPGFKTDFGERAVVSAQAEETAAGERVEASVGRVLRRDPGPGVPAIAFEQLAFPVALGANLRSKASVHVTISGQMGLAALQAVVLEMRRRSLCFNTAPGETYTLRYGDAELTAPSYEYARSFLLQPQAVALTLGPEVRNPHWQARGKEQGLRAVSPELAGVLLIAVLALAGVLLTERLRRHRPQG